MKILVTGATGFLGSFMTRRLLDEGFEVSVLARNPERLTHLSGLAGKIKVYKGDVTDAVSVESAVSANDSVFHLAGLIAYKKSQRTQMEAVNVQGTANVVDAVLKTSKGRLFYMSSVVAVGAGFTPNQILNEDSEYNVRHLNLGYFETKKMAEDLVFKAVRSRGLDAVAVCPSTVYGPGDAEKGSRGAQLKVARGEMPFYTSGGVNVVHVEDVVDLSVKVFKTAKAGQRYIAANQNLLIKDVFGMIAKAAGVPAPRFMLPRSAGFALGTLGEALERLHLPSPMSLENAWTSSLFHFFSNQKVVSAFGFSPRPAELAIEESVRWSHDHGLLDH